MTLNQHTEATFLTLYEVRALGMCAMLARESGILGPFVQTLGDGEEQAIFLAAMRSALVKLSDLEGKFPEVETSTQERLDIAAARAQVDQEQAWIVESGRDA